MYTILSLIGGGIRGALTARLLERIEAQAPFLKATSLIGGTSIGGINALYLADNKSPTDLVNLFKQHGAGIFKSRSLLEEIEGLGEVFKAKYTQHALRDILFNVFDDRRLYDLKKRVVVVSFDLDNGLPKSPANSAPRTWKPKIFHNFMDPGNDGGESIVDVALRTSAAPTYFPSHQGYIDGGVVANNPSMCALAKAVNSGVPLTEIRLLSIGTGFNPVFIEGSELDWGLEEWAPKLIPLLLDAKDGIPDYQCAQLLGSRYVHINPVLTSNIELDDASKVDELIKLADQTDISSAIKLLTS